MAKIEPDQISAPQRPQNIVEYSEEFRPLFSQSDGEGSDSDDDDDGSFDPKNGDAERDLMPPHELRILRDNEHIDDDDDDDRCPPGDALSLVPNLRFLLLVACMALSIRVCAYLVLDWARSRATNSAAASTAEAVSSLDLDEDRFHLGAGADAVVLLGIFSTLSESDAKRRSLIRETDLGGRFRDDPRVCDLPTTKA